MTFPEPPGADDFDFLTGEWDVAHRKLTQRLAGSDAWVDFSGRTSARRLANGLGNLDDNSLDDPAGAYSAMTVRYFDPATRRWAIYWIDSRRHEVEPAVVGVFEDGAGTFFADDTFEGRPIRVRFVWSEITANSARWEQAFSADGGASWEVNWVMRFTRKA
jgi:hypothetical protein